MTRRVKFLVVGFAVIVLTVSGFLWALDWLEGRGEDAGEVCSATGRVMRVVDGDTVDVYVLDGGTFCQACCKEGAEGKGMELSGLVRVRLLGVNTPEIGEPGFDEGRDAARAWVLEHRLVALAFGASRGKPERDRYGRLVGVIYAEDEEPPSLNAVLLKKSVAKRMVVRHGEALTVLRDLVYAEASNGR